MTEHESFPQRDPNEARKVDPASQRPQSGDTFSLSRSMTVPQRLSKAPIGLTGLGKALQQQQRFAANVRRLVSAHRQFGGNAQLVNMARRIGLQLQAVREAWAGQMQPVFDSMRRFGRRIGELSEAQQKALALLAPRGWLISPSLTLSAPEDMLTVIEQRGLDTLETELVALFDADYCERIIAKLFDRPSFQQWRSKLERAMEAHRRGEHDLAVPIWLIALDGIARLEFSTDEDVFENLYKQVRAGQGSRLQSRLPVPQESFARPLADALVKVIWMFSRARGDEVAEGPVLRRHAILHGEDSNFGSEKDSIQCILVLEVLHFCLSFRRSQAADDVA